MLVSPLRVSKYGPLVWALTLFFIVCAGLKVWALIAIWYTTAIYGLQKLGAQARSPCFRSWIDGCVRIEPKNLPAEAYLVVSLGIPLMFVI